MKRANGMGDEENENLGFKKVKLLNGLEEESLVNMDINKDEEFRSIVKNGAMDSAGVSNNGHQIADIVLSDHVGPSFGGLDEFNRWDYDVSFDSFFGLEEEQKASGFDLNLPVYRAPDGGVDQGCVQGPVINEKKVEIIDITSDDSENEVEITGYTYGCNTNDKQIELGMHCDRMDNLGLGLGVVTTDNAHGESSLVTGGERRYTREEKGKASAMEDDYIDDDLINSWLSLKAYSPIDLDLLTDSDEPIRLNDPTADDDVRMLEPLVEVATNFLLADREIQRAEQALRTRQAEQVLRNRQRLTRETWKSTARRFARRHFPEQDNGNQSSRMKQPPLTSRPVEELGKSPGPFSDALKMVRERTSKRTAEQLIEWRPSEDKQDRSICAPSLLDLSLKALAESAEGIVSLEQVPDNLRARLTNILCDTSKINVHIMKLLLEGCPTEIRIKNCSWLTEEQFQQMIESCQMKDLRVLQLDLCGRCMIDCAFRGTFAKSSNAFSRLSILSLRGACRLSDSGIKDLVPAAPALQSINLGQCALLTSSSINFIADSLGSNLKELYIDDCLKIEAMLILPAFKKFRCLEVLSVAGLLTVTDQFVSEMVKICCQRIKELDLANCSHLTDCSLKAIGSSCGDLCSLNISNLHNLTDLGLEYLANGCKSIQKLKLCRNGFSDEAVAAFLESSGESLTELLLNNIANVGPNTALSLAKRSRKLLSLDISWCRKISNDALGLIVDSCSSLKLLKVFGCRQITGVFLNGHSNRLVKIIGLKMGPILDHVNLLEPEEVLLKYSPLPFLH